MDMNSAFCSYNMVEPRLSWREGRYGLVDKTHPSCVRPGLNTRVQH